MGPISYKYRHNVEGDLMTTFAKLDLIEDVCIIEFIGLLIVDTKQ